MSDQTKRVVRREPQKAVFQDMGAKKWIVPLDFTDGSLMKNALYSNEEFHATFVDAELATGEQWNRFVRRLIDEAYFTAMPEIVPWLERQLNLVGDHAAEGE